MSVALVNQSLASLVLVSQVAAGIVILFFLLFPLLRRSLITYFGKRANFFSFSVALTSMLGSLYYSDIAHYAPCTLCWYQRILMYPQVLLFAIAMWRKEKITVYALALSLVGAGIAFYHYLLQNGVVSSGSCGVVGYSVSCAKNYVMTYGYITIPIMALTGFLLIALLMLAQKMAGKYAKK